MEPDAADVAAEPQRVGAFLGKTSSGYIVLLTMERLSQPGGGIKPGPSAFSLSEFVPQAGGTHAKAAGAPALHEKTREGVILPAFCVEALQTAYTKP